MRTYRDSFQALLLPLNVIFCCQSLYSATFIHSQSRMIKITFCCLSLRSTLISLILMSFWFILPYSVVIPPRSGVIRFYSRVIPPCSGIFRFILVYSALFVYHSGSFRYIPVPFLYIPSHSGVIPPHSGIFRYIPFRSCV